MLLSSCASKYWEYARSTRLLLCCGGVRVSVAPEGCRSGYGRKNRESTDTPGVWNTIDLFGVCRWVVVGRGWRKLSKWLSEWLSVGCCSWLLCSPELLRFCRDQWISMHPPSDRRFAVNNLNNFHLLDSALEIGMFNHYNCALF